MHQPLKEINYPSQNPLLHPSSCCHLKREPMVRWPPHHEGTRRAMSLCENLSSTIWHSDNRAGSRWESAQRKKASVWMVRPRARRLTVTYQWPCVENGPFFTSNCIHYIVLENERISGMKINTIETKGMKFSWEVGAPATQWVPLWHKLFPPEMVSCLCFCCLCIYDHNRQQ